MLSCLVKGMSLLLLQAFYFFCLPISFEYFVTTWVTAATARHKEIEKQCRAQVGPSSDDRVEWSRLNWFLRWTVLFVDKCFCVMSRLFVIAGEFRSLSFCSSKEQAFYRRSLLCVRCWFCSSVIFLWYFNGVSSWTVVIWYALSYNYKINNVL